MKICVKCGTSFEEGQEFCPKCGNESSITANNIFASENGKSDKNIKENKKRVIKLISIIAVIVVIVVSIVIALKVITPAKKGETAKDKLKSVSEKCVAKGTMLSSDGMSLFIDAEDSLDSDALEDIHTVLEELEIPDVVMREMETTTALMGRRVETCGDYEISWTFHPDNGLDVLVKIIE